MAGGPSMGRCRLCLQPILAASLPDIRPLAIQAGLTSDDASEPHIERPVLLLYSLFIVGPFLV